MKLTSILSTSNADAINPTVGDSIIAQNNSNTGRALLNACDGNKDFF